MGVRYARKCVQTQSLSRTHPRKICVRIQCFIPMLDVDPDRHDGTRRCHGAAGVAQTNMQPGMRRQTRASMGPPATLAALHEPVSTRCGPRRIGASGDTRGSDPNQYVRRHIVLPVGRSGERIGALALVPCQIGCPSPESGQHVVSFAVKRKRRSGRSGRHGVGHR